MGPAGEFLKLLRKPNMAKPKGDQDLPEEWDEPKVEDKEAEPKEEDEHEESEDEAAWMEKCANTFVQKEPDGEDAPADHEDVDATEEDYQEQEEEADGADDGTIELDEHDDAADGDAVMADADQEDDDDKQKKLHAKEYAEMDGARDKLANFVKGESKKRKAEDVQKEDVQQNHGWHRNRNKGNYGRKGNNKGWRGWWSPKGKGWGKGHKWSKPWRWQEWKGSGSASSHSGGGSPAEVLRADKKGGYYLPNGQGYIDANMQYHAHLGLFQC